MNLKNMFGFLILLLCVGMTHAQEHDQIGAQPGLRPGQTIVQQTIPIAGQFDFIQTYSALVGELRLVHLESLSGEPAALFMDGVEKKVLRGKILPLPSGEELRIKLPTLHTVDAAYQSFEGGGWTPRELLSEAVPGYRPSKAVAWQERFEYAVSFVRDLRAPYAARITKEDLEDQNPTYLVTNKRGVCAHYARTLAACLRKEGFYAKMVVGYIAGPMGGRSLGGKHGVVGVELPSGVVYLDAVKLGTHESASTLELARINYAFLACSGPDKPGEHFGSTILATGGWKLISQRFEPRK